MRIDELNSSWQYIPNVTVGAIENYGNNYDVSPGPTGLELTTIVVPTLIIIFPSQSMAPRQFGPHVKRAIEDMQSFYLENSYGQFKFECPLRTCELSHDRSWRGNRDKEPKYDSSGYLINQDEFPSEEDYTGYSDRNVENNKVYLDQAHTPPPFRDYSIQGENNMFGDALKAAQTPPSYSSAWDSSISYERWLNSGIPEACASNACLIFASSEFGHGVGGQGTFRDDQNIALPDGRRIEKMIHIFARSRSNMPLHKYQDNSGQWQPSTEDWFELGGQIDANPVAIAGRDDFSVYVFVRDTNGHILYRHWDSRTWSWSLPDWTDLGGPMLGPPATVQDSDGVIHLFVTGIHRVVFHKRLQGGRWYPSRTRWDPVYSLVLDSPAATAAESGGVVNVFVTGISGEVLQKTWQRGQWLSDWISLGVPRVKKTTKK